MREHAYWCQIIFMLTPHFQEQHESILTDASAQHSNKKLSLNFQLAYCTWETKREENNGREKEKRRINENYKSFQISLARSTQLEILSC